MQVLGLMLHSLMTISVESRWWPSHQFILLTQGPIPLNFAKRYWELTVLENVVFLLTIIEWKVPTLLFCRKSHYLEELMNDCMFFWTSFCYRKVCKSCNHKLKTQLCYNLQSSSNLLKNFQCKNSFKMQLLFTNFWFLFICKRGNTILCRNE